MTTKHDVSNRVTPEFFGMDAVVSNAGEAQDLAARELNAALAAKAGHAG